jgi:hypothetical protein
MINISDYYIGDGRVGTKSITNAVTRGSIYVSGGLG